uniref:Doublecortin domain-containing protein n=1 Tax=Meloidogyne hapla TaxID=6305 RepID=A0A1I8B2P0_MELHA
MTSNYTRLVPGRARRVKIYRNGDAHHKGLNVVLNYKQGQDINTLLDSISERIGLVLGAKRLFNTDGTQITSTEELEHNGEYVASSGTFTPLAYGQPASNRLGQSGGSLRRPRRDSASRSTQENNSLGSYSATRQSRSIERTSEKAASAPKQRTKKLSKKKEKAPPPPPEPSPPTANNDVETPKEEAEVNNHNGEARSPEGTTEVEVIEHDQHDDEEKADEEEEEKAEEEASEQQEEEHNEETAVTPAEEGNEVEDNEEEGEHEEGENEGGGEEEETTEEKRQSTPKTPT